MSVTTQTLRVQGDRVGARGWLALAVLMLPVLLVSIDNTVLSFAIPAIAKDLQPSSTQQLWIIDVYALVLAGLLITMGTLGDRFGRRRVLLIGALGFAVISVLAVLAPSGGWLIAARAALGVFGAMLMPSTLSLMHAVFRDRAQRRLAVAIWAAGFSAGSALGPVIGGFLLEHFHWGSVFLMSVPVLIPLLVLAPVLVPESRNPSPARVDVASIVLSMAAMTPIVYAIKELAVSGMSGAVAAMLVIGLLSGAVFIARQRRIANPMLDLALFRNGQFSGSVLVNLMSMIGYVGFMFFATQHLQLISDLGPMAAGIALLPGLVLMIVAGLAVVPVAKRLAPGVLIPLALLFSLVGFVAVAFASPTSGAGVIVAAFACIGIGVGMAETVSNELILEAAPRAKAGAASAVSETAYELGAVLGAAVLGGILTAVYRATVALPAGLGAADASAVRETLAGAMATAERIGGATGERIAAAAAQAFDSGVTITGIIAALLTVGAGVIAATTLPRRAL